ncbi:MAG TPA: hypothetical protein VGQ83_42955, partial [Polyangia bacterium]
PSSLRLDYQLWSQRDDVLGRRLTLLMLYARDDTWLAPKLRLSLWGQETQVTMSDDGAAVTPPYTQYSAHADLRYFGPKLVASTTYGYLYSSSDAVRHASNLLSSEALWTYRPNLRLRAGLALTREEVLAADPQQDLGFTRAVGTLGALVTATNPYLEWRADYTGGFGGTVIDGDGNGLLQVHRAAGSLTTRRWRPLTLALLADYLYQSDRSPLGDQTENYGAILTAEAPFAERWRAQARVQLRHSDGLDPLGLRTRISQTVLNTLAGIDLRLGDFGSVTANAYANWYGDSSQGYTSSVGSVATAAAVAAGGRFAARAMFQWELDTLQTGAQTTWVRADARAGYESGASRLELVYYSWSQSPSTRHYLLVSYSRWFDFVDSPRSRSR